jgi:hypothetical protein
MLLMIVAYVPGEWSSGSAFSASWNARSASSCAFIRVSVDPMFE